MYEARIKKEPKLIMTRVSNTTNSPVSNGAKTASIRKLFETFPKVQDTHAFPSEPEATHQFKADIKTDESSPIPAPSSELQKDTQSLTSPTTSSEVFETAPYSAPKVASRSPEAENTVEHTSPSKEVTPTSDDKEDSNGIAPGLADNLSIDVVNLEASQTTGTGDVSPPFASAQDVTAEDVSEHCYEPIDTEQLELDAHTSTVVPFPHSESVAIASHEASTNLSQPVTNNDVTTDPITHNFLELQPTVEPSSSGLSEVEKTIDEPPRFLSKISVGKYSQSKKIPAPAPPPPELRSHCSVSQTDPPLLMSVAVPSENPKAADRENVVLDKNSNEVTKNSLNMHNVTNNLPPKNGHEAGLADPAVRPRLVKQRSAPSPPTPGAAKLTTQESFEAYRMHRGRLYEVTTSDTSEGKQKASPPRPISGNKAPSISRQSPVMNGSVRKHQNSASSKRQAPEPKSGAEAGGGGGGGVIRASTKTTQISQPQQLYYQPPSQTAKQLQQNNIFRDHYRQIQESRGRPQRSHSQPRVTRAVHPGHRSWDDWSIPRVATTTNVLNGKTRPSSQQLSFRSSQLVLSVYADPRVAYDVSDEPPVMSIRPVGRPTSQSYRLARQNPPKSILKTNNPNYSTNPSMAVTGLATNITQAQGAPDVYFSTKPVTHDSSFESQGAAIQNGEMIPAAFRTLSPSKKSPPMKKKLSHQASVPVPLPPRRISSASASLHRYDLNNADSEPKRKTVTFNDHVRLHHGNSVSTITTLAVDAS